MSNAISIVYKNHRGETSMRRVEPLHLFFGSTPWHAEKQWFLQAHDFEKQAERSFAMRDVRGWDVSPEVGTEISSQENSPVLPPAIVKLSDRREGEPQDLSDIRASFALLMEKKWQLDRYIEAVRRTLEREDLKQKK